MTMTSTCASVVVIRCRKCRTTKRAGAPVLSELRGPVDREIRCPDCRTLLGIWSSSTGSF